jgi:hypothetical protein
MIDFKEYFEKGLQAAENAAANKAEIDSVFEELDRQLDEATGGKISISRKEFYVNNNAIADFLNAINRLSSNPKESKPKETYLAIVAKNKTIKDCEYIQLAKLDIHKDGYPCKITLNGDITYCEDKIALVETLQMLLSDTTVGSKLRTLINMEPHFIDAL